MRKLGRRRFVRGVGGACALAIGGCGRLGTTPNRAFLALPESAADRVAAGLYAPEGLRDGMEQAVDAIGGMPWLRPSDRVFVKVSSNSPYLHPAVTSPLAVRTFVAMLRDRGVRRVLVGDQSGVEHVRLTATGRRSSTRRMLAENGLRGAIAESGAQVHCFDDHGWDGYARAELDVDGHWEDRLILPRVLHEVDHVVYLPRISAHALAGYTGAVKCAVGWLRDDSRMLLHQKAGSFYEKLAEINHAPVIRDKLRLVLTAGERALLDIGPDIGQPYDFGGVLVVASPRLLEHDHLCAAILPWLDADDSSIYDLLAPFPEQSDFFNEQFVRTIWGSDAASGYTSLSPSPYGDRLALDAALSHLAVLEGRRPGRIDVRLLGRPLPPDLVAHLERADSGRFRLRAR